MIKYFKYSIYAAIVSGMISAASSITYAASLENVTVKLSSDERIIRVSGTVADMEKAQDVSVNARSQSGGELYAIAQEYVEADGSFEVVCGIQPDMDSAYLDIVVGGKGINNAYKVTYYYADAHESEDALEAVNAAATAQKMHETLEEYCGRGVIDADISDERYTLQSAYVDKVMADTVTKKQFGSLEEVSAAFKAALVMKDVIASDGALDIWSNNAGSLYFLNYAEYAFLDIKDKKSTQAVLKFCITDKISDVWEFGKSYKCAYALIKLNNALKSEIPELLQKYNDIYGLDLNGDYKKVSSLEMAKLLYDRSYTTIDALKTEFDNGVKKLISASSSKPSGGNSGSGGNSAKVTLPMTGTLADAEENNNYEAEKFEFLDMASAQWAAGAVSELVRYGIIDGFEDGTFRPDNLITRAEFVKMAVVGFGYAERLDGAEFGDVSVGDWYYPYVKTAAANGIVNGADGAFMPGETVTREDSAVILYHILYAGLGQNTSAGAFSDDSDIADYAADAVYKLKAAGIINGFEDGTFRPKEGLSRAQAAMILYGALVTGGNQNED